MKKIIPAILSLFSLISFAQNPSTTESLILKNEAHAPKFGWFLQYGVGASAAGPFDQIAAKDYFYYDNGVNSQAKLEIFYNLSKSKSRNFWLSSGFGTSSLSVDAMSTPYISYKYHASTMQIPLNISLVRNVADGRASTISAIGFYDRFYSSGSYIIKSDANANSLTRETLSGHNLGVMVRIGVKINLTTDLYYLGTLGMEVDVANLSQNALQTKLLNSTYGIQTGIGFNF